MGQWPRMHVGFYLCCVVCCGGLLVRLFDTYFYMLSNYFWVFLSDHICLFECFDLFEHFAHK